MKLPKTFRLICDYSWVDQPEWFLVWKCARKHETMDGGLWLQLPRRVRIHHQQFEAISTLFTGEPTYTLYFVNFFYGSVFYKKKVWRKSLYSHSETISHFFFVLGSHCTSLQKQFPLTMLELYLHHANTETEDLSSANNSESGYLKNVTLLEIYQLARLESKYARRSLFCVCDASSCQTKTKAYVKRTVRPLWRSTCSQV